jgi:hypothetical protein
MPAGRHASNSEHPLTELIEVQAQWDAEAGVWWAESADLPGLVSEAATLDALIERVSAASPDLLAVGEGPLASDNPPRRMTFNLGRATEQLDDFVQWLSLVES